MKNKILFITGILPMLLILATPVHASEDVAGEPGSTVISKTAESPENRVALLELYTSEGCSSCPPADRFLSSLRKAGITSKQLIPVAFHVTYWDYIGWKDRYADKRYDARQRDQASKNRQRTVYTPQFLLAGDDYRSYASFSEDVNKLVSQPADVDLALDMRIDGAKLSLALKSDISDSKVKDVGFYVVVIENDLTSVVDDGENEGETLHHDYVVRQMHGPYFQSQPENHLETRVLIDIDEGWKKEDLSFVAFAENPHTGEVLQAVRLKY